MDVALLYAESQEQRTNNVRVVFRINVDPSVRSAAYANIEGLSYFSGEQEFLFSMDSVFRIRGVESLNTNNQLKIFDLQLTDDEDRDLRALMERMRQDIGGTNNLINFGRLLIEMDNLDQSKQFYQIALQGPGVQDDPRTLAMIYNDLGFIASQYNFKERALRFYKAALSIGQERFPLQDAQLSPILNNIGEVYFALNDF
ncbi:unnamed protein product, partial [Rotaria sp. Silwood2]